MTTLDTDEAVVLDDTVDLVDAEGATSSAIATIRRGLAVAPTLRNGLGITWALAAVGAVGRVVVPVLLQQAIDRGIQHSTGVRVGLVVQLGIFAAVAVLVSMVANRLAVVRLGVRSEEALFDLRRRLIHHIHHLSLADHNEERRGALVARVTSDIETLNRFFSWGGLAWLLNIPLLLLVGTVMVVYDWQLALVAFALTIPLLVILRRLQRRLLAAYEVSRARNGEMMATIGELVSGAETIRAYEAGERYRTITNASVADRATANKRVGVIAATMFPLGELFAALTMGAIIAVAVVRGPGGGLTAGAIVGFIFLTYRFLEPVAEFTEVLDQTQTAVAGLRRVLRVLDTPVGPPPPLDPSALPAGRLDVRVADVTFAYPTRADPAGNGEQRLDEAVLRDVTVHIPAGQQVALVGATGSGKTTLGRLIARFADPTLGDVLLGGVSLRRVDNTELRARLVVVAQEPFLFNDSIAYNVGFAKPGTNLERIEAVVAELGLGEWIAGLPDGLSTRVGERGEELSAGERQLVALIRAGVADPDILVLDEATSSVDALTEVHISRALDRLAAGRTTIAIAHRLSTAARADRVLVMEAGRIVEDGAHAELIRADGAYRRLYDAWVAATSLDDVTR